MLRQSAIDPSVKSIKITLYRLSRQSNVISSLINAAKNGKKVLKFRTSLFKVFEDDPTLALQNFSLCYTHINSMPLDNRLRPTVAWYGGMNMITHLGKFLNLSSVDVKLVFHPVVSTNGINRKQLAETSRNQVIKGIQLIQSQNHY